MKREPHRTLELAKNYFPHSFIHSFICKYVLNAHYVQVLHWALKGNKIRNSLTFDTTEVNLQVKKYDKAVL